MKKYTITHFRKQFPDEKSCLLWLAQTRWPDGIFCPTCAAVTKHHAYNSRRVVACQNCGHQVSPTANTIYHHSSTPLSLWFHATFLMASTRCGISAKQVEREIGVTYKTAWRMCHLIRKQLDEGNHALGGGSGNVEVDETYFGGKRQGKRGRGAEGKTAVIGTVERQGQLNAIAVPNVQQSTVLPLIQSNVCKSATVYTDTFNVYNPVSRMGYTHETVNHGTDEYVRGAAHTNTIEGFWSLIKRGIDGVYHAVSPKYLQNYVAEYTFRYNHRNDETPMFLSFLNRLAADLGGKPSLEPRRNRLPLIPVGSFGRGAWEPLLC